MPPDCQPARHSTSFELRSSSTSLERVAKSREILRNPREIRRERTEIKKITVTRTEQSNLPNILSPFYQDRPASLETVRGNRSPIGSIISSDRELLNPLLYYNLLLKAILKFATRKRSEIPGARRGFAKFRFATAAVLRLRRDFG